MPEGFIQRPDLLNLPCQRLGSLLNVHWSRLASGPADAACSQSARGGEGAIVFGWLLEGDAEEEVDETNEEEEPGCGEGKAFGVVRKQIGADLVRNNEESAKATGKVLMRLSFTHHHLDASQGASARIPTQDRKTVLECFLAIATPVGLYSRGKTQVSL